MRTLRIFTCFFKAPVFCFLCICECTVDCSRLSGPKVVNGTYSGSVTVSCQYDLRYREHTKYWCKGPVYGMCTIVVKTPKNRHNDRIFISDNKEAGVFTVTMTSLSETDMDIYWCVISKSGKNIFTRVKLLVSHEASTTCVIRWWAILRWIIFILMLCCLALTYYAVRRIRNGNEILRR